MSAEAIRLHVPASSANLGSGFDTAAVALPFGLAVQARAAAEFSVEAAGVDADRIGGEAAGHFIVEAYRGVMAGAGRQATALALRLDNAIPVGKGCGSSAAARVAAVRLANHFGGLGWDEAACFGAAARLEGHPDNAAACIHGGFVVANPEHTARWPVPAGWSLVVGVPAEALATEKARALLPANYARADVVGNLQALALLIAAFAQGREELLAAGMRDAVHQPYRAGLCPLLPALAPLAGEGGILGVALSGAGPSVLMVVRAGEEMDAVGRARAAAAKAGLACPAFHGPPNVRL